MRSKRPARKEETQSGEAPDSIPGLPPTEVLDKLPEHVRVAVVEAASFSGVAGIALCVSATGLVGRFLGNERWRARCGNAVGTLLHWIAQEPHRHRKNVMNRITARLPDGLVEELSAGG